MEAYKLREKILREVNEADEILLRVMDDAIEAYHHTQFPMVSEPISIEQYNRELDIADEQIPNGDVFTQEDVSELIKRWGRR